MKELPKNRYIKNVNSVALALLFSLNIAAHKSRTKPCRCKCIESIFYFTFEIECNFVHKDKIIKCPFRNTKDSSYVLL